MKPRLLKTPLAALLFLAAAPALFAADSAITVNEANGRVRVQWPISAAESGVAVFNMDAAQPLIESLGIKAKGQAEPAVIAAGLNPLTVLTVGERDLNAPGGWVMFFDSPYRRPYKTDVVKLGERKLKVTPGATRTTISVGSVSTPTFAGDLRFTFYTNSPLIQAETVVATKEDSRAIVYDAGLTSAAPSWQSLVWTDTAGQVQRAKFDPKTAATPVAVAGRTIVAESPRGSLAVFPAPHQFFYPQDEAFNLKFVWHGHDYGRDYGVSVPESGFGIRQTLMGDKRHVPWFNAPPSTEQHLSAYYLLASGAGEGALKRVAAYTHDDKYPKLPGYHTYTSHYHVEHSRAFMEGQKKQGVSGVPKGLEVPSFVKTFKAHGVDIAHMAEFHYEKGASLPDETRLQHLKVMHDEFARLSDNELLIIPGEEPNVELGGHWISLFPKPVYWTLARAKEQPFVEQSETYGTVYHVGSPEDVLALMEKENGLMWTAHARIKSSLGFPDKYKDADFFHSDRFMGAAWKQMPGDLSRPTLGWRVLDLLDDMSNWGERKQVIGEVDVFTMESENESYAHMNINYVRLDKLPRFAEGWQPVLDALRGGRFFTTTGEILIPEYSVGGKASGQVLDPPAQSPTMIEAQLSWTFPLAFAEVVSGDGKEVFRQRVDLSNTESFGTRKLQIPASLQGRKWVRFEVWDIAANGAFTQPVWIGAQEPRPVATAPAKKEKAPKAPKPPKETVAVSAAPSTPSIASTESIPSTPTPPKAPKPAPTPAPTPADAEAPRTFARFVPERADDFAWENDMIAFRAYGPAIRPANKKPKPSDEDSGIDIWSKRVPYPIIDRWYANEKKGLSYHADHGEGMDFYKVGGSRGCGGTALWKDGKMIVSGPFKSWKIISSEPAKTVFELTYLYDLGTEKIQEVKRISIAMGERLFRSESTFTKDGKPASVEVAIGVTTHAGKAAVGLKQAEGWMSVWEETGGGIGTGVVMDPKRIASMTEEKPADGNDGYALIIARTDAEGKVAHWTGYGWAKAGAITTAEQWNQYLATFAKTAK